MKTWCPRCKQGWVTLSRVKATGEIVSVCEECEALWPDSVVISFETFVDMSIYLTAQGLSGQWTDLEDVE
jgi:hypothetical protein